MQLQDVKIKIRIRRVFTIIMILALGESNGSQKSERKVIKKVKFSLQK